MHTVYLDQGDHFLVLADYTKSPRHAALSEAQWKAEYKNHPSYNLMRKGSPLAIAGITPKGGGRWLKDWSGPYKKSALSLACVSPADFDGVLHQPANGMAVHKVSVTKMGIDGKPAVSLEEIRALISATIPMTPSKAALVGGKAEIIVGPCTMPCDFTVTVVDSNRTLPRTSLRLRFS